MKLVTKKLLTAFFIIATLHANAQWTQTAFKGKYVGLLKHVNGKLFAYTINLNTYQGGLYTSVDSGSTWNSTDSSGAFAQILVHDITYDSAHNDYVAVASAQQGVYYSADGFGWTNSGTNWSGEAVVYINNRDILSNGNSGPAYSTDGGRSWTSSVTGLFAPYYDHSLVRVHDTLFLAQQGITCFTSTTDGNSWVKNDSNMIYFMDCFFEHNNIVYSGLYIAGVAYFQNKKWNYDTTGLTLATDTWTLCDAGDTLFCGGDTGVWMNYNGTWKDFSCSLPPVHVYRLQHVSHYLFAGTDSGIYTIDLHSSTNCSSGIVQVETQNNIKISPTITNDFVTIYSESVPRRVEVINVNGEVVEVVNSSFKIDVNTLPQGIYFLRITMNSGQVFTDKIAKQ